MRSFQGRPNATVNIAVSASSQAVLVYTGEPGAVVQVRVMNNGSATAWQAFGDSTVTTSTSAGRPFGSGATEVLTTVVPASGQLYAAAIAAGVTGSMYFEAGIGL